MSEEILFRRAAFGGFNRSDVLQYISNVSLENGEREIELSKAKTDLAEAKKAVDARDDKIRELRDEIESLKAKLDVKNSRVASLESEIEIKTTRLMSMQRELEAKKTLVDDTAKKDSNTSAERLIQNSITYAESYIQSAGLVVGNVKRETLDKLNEAANHISMMNDTAAELTENSQKFNVMLEKLNRDILEAAKKFEDEKKE